LVAASGDRLPSVVIFRLRNMQPDQVNNHLNQVIAHHKEQLEQGAIVSVTEGMARVRILPITPDK